MKPASIAARTLLFALIGAAATVLVAWGFSVNGPDPRVDWGQEERARVALREQLLIRPHDMSRYFVALSPARREARGIDVQLRFVESEPHAPANAQRFVRIGAPALALSYKRIQSSAGAATHDGIPSPHWLGAHAPSMGGKRILPLKPLWPGFLVDTAFWGGAAFLVWSVPGLVRRGVRRRWARCVGCGYELAGLSACPECGGAA